MVPGDIHQKRLVHAINSYFSKGYCLISLNSEIIPNYRPDAVFENEEEIVIVEVIESSESLRSLDSIQPHFSKTVRREITRRIKRLRKSERSNQQGFKTVQVSDKVHESLGSFMASMSQVSFELLAVNPTYTFNDVIAFLLETTKRAGEEALRKAMEMKARAEEGKAT